MTGFQVLGGNSYSLNTSGGNSYFFLKKIVRLRFTVGFHLSKISEVNERVLWDVFVGV